jgi:hypothetical protein
LKTSKTEKDGTPHHAARGYVVLWATIMAHARPNTKGSTAVIAREMMDAIDLDERRKDKGETHVL